MPVVLLEIGFAGPTTEHMGNAVLRHIVSKSPKPMASCPFGAQSVCDDVSLLGVGVGVRFEREGGVVLFKVCKAQRERARSSDCSKCVICKGESNAPLDSTVKESLFVWN